MHIHSSRGVIAAITIVAALFSRGLTAQSTSSPSDTTRFVILFSNRPAGHLKVWREGQEIVSDYEYNDRGRGPHIVERMATDASGYLTNAVIRGHSYFKDSVDERFSYANGRASWKNHVEGESSAVRALPFYMSLDGTPAENDPFLQAIFAGDGKPLPLFPTGEATIDKVRDLEITGPGSAKRTVSLYAISGLSFAPVYLWLDPDKHFFANVSSWSSTIREGWEPAVPAMIEAQEAADAVRFQTLAKTLARRPTGALVFRNANLFDAVNARMIPHTTVVISGNKIQSVSPDQSASIPTGAQVIDAAGKALLPGLWDMHVHVSPGTDGILHIAAGVTTARDMGNDTTNVLNLQKKFGDGSLIGPRLVLAGLIDAPGPYQVPTGVLASTDAEVRKAVNRYADMGFEQIKVYSSMKPELVPAIIEEAHRRGLRVSGHVPAFMTAEQVVRLGFDEVQHVNFVMLNFMDTVKDTRSMSRFTAVAKDGAGLDFSSSRVKSFFALLRERHTVIDPTVGTFEDMFVGRAGEMSPSLGMVADRFPSQVRRGLFSGGLPVPAGMDQRYRDSYAAMVKMVGELYRAGISIVAGTDAMPGFGLHRELELWVRAGIPPAEVLRRATLGAAQVMKHDDTRGSIAPGKLADVILVAGDPATSISDIRKVELVVKDGVIYRSADLYKALGIR
ncbi:MAG TPA: amidohydrolase family protein [Gemmatimonadaceae bacterium]|nr:amidohydrolase family protein [Gemmatimonadaceae bacterium]